MWVFGYGSLMWDGWEARLGCLLSVRAELPGYARTFNKASVRNWGSKAAPGPTLNLKRAATSCVGMAFDFPDDQASEVRAYLTKREGRDFALRTTLVKLDGGEEVDALVPFYEGENLVQLARTEEIAALVKRARGTEGPCTSYVIGISDKLRALGISDPVVEALRSAIDA